jgi:hypothetical protein
VFFIRASRRDIIIQPWDGEERAYRGKQTSNTFNPERVESNTGFAFGFWNFPQAGLGPLVIPCSVFLITFRSGIIFQSQGGENAYNADRGAAQVVQPTNTRRKAHQKSSKKKK